MSGIRKLLLLFALLIHPAFAVNALVQATSTTSALSGTTMSLAFSSNVTSGNLLVTDLRYGAPANPITSVTGTSGHCSATWTIVGPSSMTGETDDVKGGWAYSFANGTGACTVTWNLSLSNSGGVVDVAEFSGPTLLTTTSTPGQGGSSTTVTTNTSTPNSGDLLIGFFESQFGAASVTPGTGFTTATTGTSGGTVYTAITYKLSATAGSQTTSLTWASSPTASIGWLSGRTSAGPAYSNHSSIM